MEQKKLGQLITDPQDRDAVHVAIAPVTAAQPLQPGYHVGFLEPGNTNLVGLSEKPVGIVDPFLADGVKAGERFWLVLYPQTVTSLRHDWTHPAFGAFVPTPDADKAWSEQWLRVYATKMNPYDDREKAFQRLLTGLRTGEMESYGRDMSCLGDLDQPDELKEHAERYLGIRIEWGRFTFSCSC